jgi:hypothetical protein
VKYYLDRGFIDFPLSVYYFLKREKERCKNKARLLYFTFTFQKEREKERAIIYLREREILQYIYASITAT